MAVLLVPAPAGPPWGSVIGLHGGTGGAQCASSAGRRRPSNSPAPSDEVGLGATNRRNATSGSEPLPAQRRNSEPRRGGGPPPGEGPRAAGARPGQAVAQRGRQHDDGAQVDFAAEKAHRGRRPPLPAAVGGAAEAVASVVA